MATYYKHSHGCGSGYVDSYIKISKNDQGGTVAVRVRYGWMGDGKLEYDLSCTLFPVSGPYNVLRIDRFADIKTTTEHKADTYFDMYIFDEVLETEWLKYPIDDIPIGLYMGNGCRSTEKFQLQLNRNKTILSEETNPSLEKIINIIDGLKYEKITEAEYLQLL